MNKGCVKIESVVPRDLRDLFHEGSQIGIGYDVATTANKKSNPNAVAVTEKNGVDFVTRFLLRWKTSDDQIAIELLRAVLMALSPRRPRALAIDATSEKFFATRTRRELAPIVPVRLIVSSESTEYMGEPMLMKAYLGNLLVNTIEDNHLTLPNFAWLKKDIRSVKRDRGSFVAEIDENGNHGDCFDAIKLSLHALVAAGGPAAANAAAVGSFGSNPSRRNLNPLSRLFKSTPRINA